MSAIVRQPIDTTIQFGDNFGNINHQGVLGSNVGKTPSLSTTFPTTSTGTSLGHFHFTEPGTNALQFLNCSGTGTGGHKFYTANSTTAPINTATFDSNGLTIDKSSSGTPPIYSPNVFLLAPDGKNIELDGDLYAPPYNFNLQTFNPVYMTQTTSYYTAGDLCYLVADSDRVVQIFNNNNTTNPIPPNVVPSDFDNSSNVGITLGIPLFTLSPIVPSIIKTSNLSYVLTLTDDSDESILTARNLTINNVIQTPISSIIVNPSSFYYGANTAPTTSATILTNYGYSGWYYLTSSDVITWAFPVRKNATVADLKGISVHFFNVASTFEITVYTATGSKSYTLPTLTTNTPYQGVAILATNQVPNNETTVAMQASTPIGTFLQTDLITNAVIETTTSNEFVISKLNFHYTDVVISNLLN